MKKIYIDITNIPMLTQFTGISRVVSEIILRLEKEKTDFILLSYNPSDHAYRVIDSAVLVNCFENMTEDRKSCYTDKLITVEQFEKNSVFLEINSCWHTLPNRSFLLPQLKNKNIRIITQIYDLIPLRYPQYMASVTLMKFMEFITAHLTYTDDIIVNTDAVKQDVLKLFEETGIRPKPVHVINLGADFSVGNKSDGEEADEKIIRKLQGRRFILSVGTIEPRKNHKLIVEAYEKRLSALDTDVVFVGRTGWQMEELTDRIKSNPKFDNGIYMFSNVSDATLSELYSMAFMIAFPSYTEGYGLPTIEALIKGVPVVCSDIPVMREVGQKFCEYFPPDDPDAFAGIIEEYVNSEEKYRLKKKQIAEEYRPPLWSDTVKNVISLVNSSRKPAETEHGRIKQIVYLSARPAPLLATLPFVEEFMPFIEELVVCCPDDMAVYMKENYRGRLKLTVVTDDELLAGNALPADHSTRNFYLRCLAMRLEILDDEFIMSDDDYRPLDYVSEEVFFKDGKYRGYYFSDISTWKYRITEMFSYDYSHMRTLKFLKAGGYPTLQYSAHQPQVINRKWYCELIDEYPDIVTLGYDEWSTYFNYCAVRHPDEYEAVPFVTLSWPNIGGENFGVNQSDYVFENFYKENYYGTGSFLRFPEGFTDAEGIIKGNERKKKIALDYLENYEKSRVKREKFRRDYETEYHQHPDFAVYFYDGKDREPVLGCPASFRVSPGCLSKLCFGISRAPNCAMNIMTARISADITDGKGNVLCSGAVDIHPHTEYSSITFIVPEGDYKDRELFVKVAVRNKFSGVTAEKIIPVMTENE